ncbi:MAG: hypothetical protein V4517_10045 [Pseudomonadota bacterium]
MANRGSNPMAPAELVARLGGLLMALVAGKDQRLRETIASAVARARPLDDAESMKRWNARHRAASNRRVE